MDKFVNIFSRFLDSSKNRPFDVKQHGALNECYGLAHYYTGRREGSDFIECVPR